MQQKCEHTIRLSSITAVGLLLAASFFYRFLINIPLQLPACVDGVCMGGGRRAQQLSSDNRREANQYFMLSCPLLFDLFHLFIGWRRRCIGSYSPRPRWREEKPFDGSSSSSSSMLLTVTTLQVFFSLKRPTRGPRTLEMEVIWLHTPARIRLASCDSNSIDSFNERVALPSSPSTYSVSYFHNRYYTGDTSWSSPSPQRAIIRHTHTKKISRQIK